VAKRIAFRRVELVDAGNVAARKNHGFKRPDRPVRHKREKMFVLDDSSGARIFLQPVIIAKQTQPMRIAVGQLRFLLHARNVGDGCGGPDLAMRMGVAGAHHRAAILENLHVIDVVARAKLHKLSGPGIYDGAYVGRLHHRECQVMFGRKTEDAADSSFRFRDE
jgi:hypothetical protein